MVKLFDQKQPCIEHGFKTCNTVRDHTLYSAHDYYNVGYTKQGEQHQYHDSKSSEILMANHPLPKLHPSGGSILRTKSPCKRKQ